MLRAGLPDHHIFANARLADVIQLSGQPTTPQARAHFAQGRIDFVVCNKNLSIVALIDLVDGARSDDALKRALEPQFATGGVRYLRVASNAIPKPADVRVCLSELIRPPSTIGPHTFNRNHVLAPTTIQTGFLIQHV